MDDLGVPPLQETSNDSMCALTHSVCVDTPVLSHSSLAPKSFERCQNKASEPHKPSGWFLKPLLKVISRQVEL